MALPAEVIRKVYHDNAVQLLAKRLGKVQKLGEMPTRVIRMPAPVGIVAPLEHGYHRSRAMVFHGRKDGPVSLTVKELADLVQGIVHGDGSVAIHAASASG